MEFRKALVIGGALGFALLSAGCSETQAPAASFGLPGYGSGSGSFAPGSQREFSQNVGDTVHFESDRSDLTPQARAILAAQAQWLRQYPNHSILIEGHADERGTREYNIALGAKRAETTRSFLAANGVNPRRMRTISYGKERPVAVCDNITCWSQNRRTVTVLGGGGVAAAY
jgi:peptidoglycan-associated lipoprotein